MASKSFFVYFGRCGRLGTGLLLRMRFFSLQRMKTFVFLLWSETKLSILYSGWMDLLIGWIVSEGRVSFAVYPSCFVQFFWGLLLHGFVTSKFAILTPF